MWESSVKATHLFLSENEIESIKKYVPQALNEIPHLIIAENENQVPVGFMGIVKQHLEMLFISHEERGKGFGKALIQYGIKSYSINDLAVNEQNPLAKDFYEHMGFKVYKRTANDEKETLISFIYEQIIIPVFHPHLLWSSFFVTLCSYLLYTIRTRCYKFSIPVQKWCLLLQNHLV